jgi:membrane-associated phospholipid phosphatase
VLAIILVIISLAQSFIQQSEDTRKVFISAVKRSREMLLIIPTVLFVAIIAIAMGQANMFARARLQDGVVIGWEHSVFGNYVFAALGNIHYPHWLIAFIISSFQNMSLILIAVGMLAAYRAPHRFRELLVAFCIGILLMVPLWLMLPVLSPQDRYINDVYQLPTPTQITSAVASYHPQPELSEFLAGVRVEKTGLPAMPTSTIPSAHIFWAVLTGYYLFRLKKWLGWITLPVLLASSYGTILLAQHYFMDVPAGIIIGIIAIYLAHEVELEIEAKGNDK